MTVRSTAVATARETSFDRAEGHSAYCAGVAGAAMPIVPGPAPSVTTSRGAPAVTLDMHGVVAMRGRRMRNRPG